MIEITRMFPYMKDTIFDPQVWLFHGQSFEIVQTYTK